ncbi:MAG: DNA primase [Nitrospirota bacterium]
MKNTGAMKSDALIDDIKARLDIVDLVSEHVDLKRAGQNYKGLCPFHTEKTPSFMVSPSKQIFHCFGCSKGGDIFAFVMDYENMTFQEALSHLAGKAGISLERIKGGSSAAAALKEVLYALNREAMLFFQRLLASSGQARAYLEERGLSSGTVEHFALGCSAGDRDALLSHLKKKGFSPEQIKASGLVHFGERGAHDFFRERVMFPISDLQGKVIAFGGRTLSSSKSVPKYLNSPDSPIFRKGDTCYALHHAKQAIVQKNYTIIVEGYLDAITCHQHGFLNTVAPLGTALTAGHVHRLKRLSSNVLLLFDGDTAGAAAAKRSLELIFAEAMTAKVLMLPTGEDPDTFLRTYGPERFKFALSKAVSPVEFLMKLYGKKKIEAAKYALSLIPACPDALLRDETLREIASWSGLNEHAVREELKKIKPKPLASPYGARSSAGDARQELQPKRERRDEEEILLNIALSLPEKAPSIVRRLNPDTMEDTLARRVFEKMRTLMSDDESTSSLTERLLALCGNEERALITKHAVAPHIDQQYVDRNIEDCLDKVLLRGIEGQIKAAERDARETGDTKQLHALITEKRKLLQKIADTAQR